MKKSKAHNAGTAALPPKGKGDAADDDLARDFASWMANPLTKRCMGHLRGIAFRTMSEQTLDTTTLTFREGQRNILATADALAKQGGL